MIKVFKIKIVFLVISVLIMNFGFSVTLYAQDIPQEAINKYNLNSNSGFFEIRDAMNEYWASKNVQDGYVIENGQKNKLPGWKMYMRWEYYWEQRVNNITGEFPKTNSSIEYKRYIESIHAEKGNSDNSESWINLGTNSSEGGYFGIGRINCVTFHPTDLNTFWVGSPSGGIWKTSNGGNNWTVLNDNQPVLGVSNIIVPNDYEVSNTIYIATGDRDIGSLRQLGGGQSNDNLSIGVLKSIDGGLTWNSTGLSYTVDLGKKVYSLLIHPLNNQTLFASTTDGIFKTTNGGTTWIQKANSDFKCWRLAFKPGDPNVIYGSIDIIGEQYIAVSVNAGETWTDHTFGSGTDARRTELAVSPADPDVIYLLTCTNLGGLNGIFKSVNSGSSFTKVNLDSLSMLGYESDGSGPNRGQGPYDLCIAVSPDDADIVYIGGINTWKSVNGGADWVCVNHWINPVPQTVHADKHALSFQNGSTLFEGNDGGIYKTTNGGTNWIDLSNGLVISQLYRIGVSQTSSSVVLSGLQDNGSKIYRNGNWTDIAGGDGTECIIDYNNSDFMYASVNRGRILISYDNGQTFNDFISTNIPGGQPVGAWVSPYVIDPTNSTSLFAGYDKVWKTTDRGDNWLSASQVLSPGAKLRSLAIAQSSTEVLYVADLNNMWKTNDGGATDWSLITLPNVPNNITGIAVKDTDPNTLWITYGGYTPGEKIYKSTNGGFSWTNESAGLPNLPVMCVLYDKSISGTDNLFIGADVGVYQKEDSQNWVLYNTGLPNVIITELEMYFGSGEKKMRAATYGRGLWETNIDFQLPVELASFSSTINENTVNLNWITNSEINNYGFDIERSLSNGEWSIIGFVNGNGTSSSFNNYTYTDRNLASGNYSYRLKQIDFNGNFEYFNLSNEVVIGVPEKFELSQNYPNPFNPSTKINYNLPADGMVSIKIFDMSGKEVMSLVNEVMTAGYYSVSFNGSNLSSGNYFYRLSAADFTATKKMILLK